MLQTDCNLLKTIIDVDFFMSLPEDEVEWDYQNTMSTFPAFFSQFNWDNDGNYLTDGRTTTSYVVPNWCTRHGEFTIYSSHKHSLRLSERIKDDETITKLTLPNQIFLLRNNYHEVHYDGPVAVRLVDGRIEIPASGIPVLKAGAAVFWWNDEMDKILSYPSNQMEWNRREGPPIVSVKRLLAWKEQDYVLYQYERMLADFTNRKKWNTPVQQNHDKLCEGMLDRVDVLGSKYFHHVEDLLEYHLVVSD